LKKPSPESFDKAQEYIFKKMLDDNYKIFIDSNEYTEYKTYQVGTKNPSPMNVYGRSRSNTATGLETATRTDEEFWDFFKASVELTDKATKNNPDEKNPYANRTLTPSASMNSVSDKLMMEKPEKSESKKDLSPRDPKVYVGVCAMAERENWKDILMVLKKNPFVIHLFDLNKVNVPFQKNIQIM